MTLWFTSDTHFSHANILNLGAGRPFDTIEEHDEVLVDNFSSVMSEDDFLIHLGDVALGPWPQGLSYLERIPGTKILVPGNHDRVSSVEKKSRRDRFRPDYLSVFTDIWNEVSPFYLVDNFSIYRLRMSHYPFSGESDPEREDRYNDLRPVDDGWSPLIHGHTHSSEKVSRSDAGALQISVGVDAWNYFPVSEEDLINLIRENG